MTGAGKKRDMAVLEKLFVDHPRSLGMSWAGHGVGAFGIGCRMIGAGCACIVHALVPAAFTETAGRTVTDLHDHMQRRRASAPSPDSWPDYEI